MKRIIIAFAALIVIVALWSGVWLFVAGRIDAAIAAAATPPQPNAASLECGSTSVTGFPFRFDVDCRDARLTQDDIVIALPGLKATALVYRPTHFIAEATGPASLTDAFYGTAQQLRWQQLRASLRLDGWHLARLSVEGEAVSWHDTLLGDTLLAQSPKLEAHLRDAAAGDAPAGLTDLQIYLSAEGTDLPQQDIAGAELTAEAVLSGMPADIRDYADPALLRRWQQAGGALTLTQLTITDSQSRIGLEGEMALNGDGELGGQIAIASHNVAERFGGMLDPNLTTLVFGPRQPDGGHAQNLTITRGAVFAGVLPLGAVPPLF